MAGGVEVAVDEAINGGHRLDLGTGVILRMGED